MIAGSWLIASVHIDLTKQTSSTIAAVMRQQLAEPGAGLAVLGELEVRAGERDRRLLGRHAGEALAAADVVGQLLAVLLVEQRLVVEEVLLGGAAGLEEVDDALDARREVAGRELRRQRLRRGLRRESIGQAASRARRRRCRRPRRRRNGGA